MQEYVIGQDTFSHLFVVKRKSNLATAVKNFAMLFANPLIPVGCMLAFSALGAFIIGLVDAGIPFFQSFYLQLFILALFLLGLVWVMRKRLQSNCLPEGQYRMEADENRICLTSANLGLQRYGVYAVSDAKVREGGTDLVLDTGFLIPVDGLKLSLAGNRAPQRPETGSERNVWFSKDIEAG